MALSKKSPVGPKIPHTHNNKACQFCKLLFWREKKGCGGGIWDAGWRKIKIKDVTTAKGGLMVKFVAVGLRQLEGDYLSLSCWCVRVF